MGTDGGEELLVVYHRANIRSEGFVGSFLLEVRWEKSNLISWENL